MKIKQFTSVLGAFVALIMLIAGCNSTADDTTKLTAEVLEMTPVEQETVKKEISARIDEIVQGANALDIEAAIKPYSASPEFLIVSPDGSVADYQTMKKAQIEFFNMAASNTFTTKKEDFRFLSRTLVLCTWQGVNAFVLKSGERFKIADYVGSMLFSKIDGEWKIIYAHESATQPAEESVEK